MGGGNPYPLNENYFFKLGCHQHRFDPLCMECMEERADKSDLSWNEVLELIWEQTEKGNNIDTTPIKKSNVPVTKSGIQPTKNKTKIRFWAQYSFRHNPFLTFMAEKSNYQEAVRFGIKEVNYILTNFQNGLEMIIRKREKYIKTGAYQILDKNKKTQLLAKPHNFIPAFLVENSQSSPVRQVLNASKFYPQQETFLNVNMNNLPCRSPNQGNVLLSFILYSNPVSLDVSAAFHCIKIL